MNGTSRYISDRMSRPARYLSFSLLLYLFFFGIFYTVGSQTYSATVKLQQLPSQERELSDALRAYLDTCIQSEERKQGLEEFLLEAERANSVAASDSAFVEKPTNAFLLLRRLVEGWGHIADTICDGPEEEHPEKRDFCHKRESMLESGTWPTRDDLYGAASAMIRLVDFYKLNFDDLANGTLYGERMLPLSIDDFLFIANAAVEEGQEFLASVWYENTLKLVKKRPDVETAVKTRLQRKLAGLYYKNSMFSKANSVIQQAVRDNPQHKGAKRDLDLFSTRNASRGGVEPSRIPRPEFFIDDKVMSTYRRLCRERIMSPTEQAALRCLFRETSIPFMRSKVEYASVSPPVVLIHEVLTDKEMNHVKNTAKAYLTRSVVGEKGEMSNIRISQTAWLGETDDILRRMSKKVELHTGLSAPYTETNSHAEPWQVLNYGLGGLYVPHDDSVKELREQGFESKAGEPMQNSGDRMATFLFYLNDVTAGGTTVFPYLKARVPVVKGAAALWYNLYRNGNKDTRLLHAGCPVLIGSKWVSNKWIREIGQTFRRPCSLDENQ